MAAGGTALTVGATGMSGTVAADSPDGVADIETQTSCDSVHWNYAENDDGSYSKKSPINVIARGYDVEDVMDIASDAGWETGNKDGELDEIRNGDTVCEYDRYIYNEDGDYMMGPDNQPNDGYGTIATGVGCGGTGERYHARCYEIEPGIVAIQAHHDPEDHDDDTTYRSAELEVVELLLNHDSASGVDTKNLNNEKDDHNGVANVVEADLDEVDVNC